MCRDQREQPAKETKAGRNRQQGFSLGFPGVFPWFSWGFPGVFKRFSRVFPRFSRCFPGVFPGFSPGFPDFLLLFFGDKSGNLSKIVSVLISALAERFFVSRMRDFFLRQVKIWEISPPLCLFTNFAFLSCQRTELLTNNCLC